MRPGLTAGSAVPTDVTLAVSFLHLGQYRATSPRGLVVPTGTKPMPCPGLGALMVPVTFCPNPAGQPHEA